MKNAQMPFSPRWFLPPELLPPVECIQPAMRDLVETVARRLERQVYADCVHDILRLMQPYGEIAGTAQCVQGLPVGCFLAVQSARHKGYPEVIPGIQAIGKVLTAADIQEEFPDIAKRPTRSENPLLHVHLALGACPAYPVLALNLQTGLLTALEKSGWQRTARTVKTLSALFSSLLRVVPQIPFPEFSEAWEMGDPMKCMAILEEVIHALPRLRGREMDRPLAADTLTAYLRDIALLLNQPDWLMYRSTLGRMGGIAVLEEDPDEESSFAEAYSPLAESTRQELDPGAAMDPEYWEPVRPGHVLSSEQAVLEEYPALIRFATTTPNAAAELARVILASDGRPDPNRLQGRARILSHLLTGRSGAFLDRITVGAWPAEGESVDNPRYVVDRGCVVYPPDIGAHGLPAARGPQDVYTPVSPFWMFPLPALLQPMWRSLAEQNGGRPFQKEFERGDDIYRRITGWIRTRFPGSPTVTEARLRSAFTALMICIGQMDPLLAAFVSGQWRFAHRAPLFYTTISSDLLADRFHASFRRVWDALRELQPEIPEYTKTSDESPDAIWMGSVYRPNPKSVRRTIQTLQRQAREAGDADEAHNRRTIMLLYLLGTVAGLRFGEMASLRAIQFDLDVSWAGDPLPWLVIDQGKGNRFTTAARIIPLPPAIANLARTVISTERDGPAFYVRKNGKRLPATETMLHERLQAVRSGPRWHAGRHFLRSWLCEQGMDFDLLNALMGHQAQGRELLNPHLPNQPWRLWREMAAWLERFTVELGVEVLP